MADSIPVCHRPFPDFSLTREEVPIVNKPRRACSYFKSTIILVLIEGNKIKIQIPVVQLLFISAAFSVFTNWQMILRTFTFIFPRRPRFIPKIVVGCYAFISTSTPEGRSSLLKASTVREEEV